MRYVPVAELEILEKHIRATELITHILTTYHYKKTNINDELSSDMNNCNPNLTADDIQYPEYDQQ